MSEPKIIRAGDSVSWTASYSDYSAADGWSLSYAIVGNSGGFTGIAGVAAGSNFDVSITAAQTKQLVAGDYRLVGRVSKGAEVITVCSVELKVEANLFDIGPGSDVRSGSQRGLDAIIAVMEKRASKDQENYSINGRSLSRTPIADLITLRRFYEREVHKERKAERIASGLGAGNTIKVRF